MSFLHNPLEATPPPTTFERRFASRRKTGFGPLFQKIGFHSRLKIDRYGRPRPVSHAQDQPSPKPEQNQPRFGTCFHIDAKAKQTSIDAKANQASPKRAPCTAIIKS